MAPEDCSIILNTAHALSLTIHSVRITSRANDHIVAVNRGKLKMTERSNQVFLRSSASAPTGIKSIIS